MASTPLAHHHHYRHFPRFGRVGWNLKSLVIQVCKPCHCRQDGWGYRFFQAASNIHMFSIYSVWAPSIVVDGHMDAQLRCYHHTCFPRLWELAEILSDVSVKTMPLKNGWGYRTFQSIFHISTFTCCGCAHGHNHRHGYRFGRVGWNLLWC